MNESMKQVAVRMPDKLHSDALRMAARESVSFGEFVREAVRERIESLKRVKNGK